MQKHTLSTIIFCTSTLFTSSAFAADACETVLCLYGKITGSDTGSECQNAERDFFTIVKTNRWGFLPAATAGARQAYLAECASADPAIIRQIITQFGRLRG
ncbi:MULTISPECIES: TrbM/KikA/MpfK family conjugal transfer protein [unclassified Symbiopectobacterium]|uniref:TrbM/KikA/MpfK family conjugal transfer protein n=1 Tax=unclassified Symbiopectobacterium TaxID=2794573 RepID=UPI0022274836|nr:MULTISPECIES: TrbM/KikA/MpfK family conjugal transfer protein [unclassified Symbiopectobacterium]MCW2474533.1 conjugal transfer protein [Candidatus Symbiopectobacterium sp. NZEC151]MCW2488825.1 conjugal transfer protein [Candidatus Symbiopectobacterium sp. NZEC127]